MYLYEVMTHLSNSIRKVFLRHRNVLSIRPTFWFLPPLYSCATPSFCDPLYSFCYLPSGLAWPSFSLAYMIRTCTIGMVSIRRKTYSPKILEKPLVVLHLVTLQLFFFVSIILERKFCRKQNFSSLIISLDNDPPPLWTILEVKLHTNILHFTHSVFSMKGSIVPQEMQGNNI